MVWSVPRRGNKSVPVAVRLAPDDVAAIEALADQLDVPISALLRGWILDALTAKARGVRRNRTRPAHRRHTASARTGRLNEPSLPPAGSGSGQGSDAPVRDSASGITGPAPRQC